MRAAPIVAATLLRLVSTCDVLSIDSPTPTSLTRQYFASFNIDSSRQRSYFDVDIATPQLAYLASQIGGGNNIRFGGTGNDFLYYEVPGLPPCPTTIPYINECFNMSLWQSLTSFASSSASGLIFGLSLLPFNSTWTPNPYPKPTSDWVWNSTNAAALLRHAKASGTPLWGLECGNEDNSKGWAASQQASALVELTRVLDDVYGDGPDRPVLVGPDASGFHDAVVGGRNAAILAYMVDFLNQTQSFLRAITHHEYIEITYENVLNHTFLDATRDIADAVVAAVRAVNATTEIWAGEIGPHNGGDFPNPNCASNRVCGRFGSALWYADAMSAVARAGYSAFQRQDFIGADYGLVNYTSFRPSPDYWLLYLWRRVVGTAVLDVRNGRGNPSVRAYGFCARAPSRVALIVLNLDAADNCVALPADAVADSEFLVWSMTAGEGGVESADVLLNGVLLELDGNGRIPPTDGALILGTNATLPAQSISFFVYNTTLAACSGA